MELGLLRAPKWPPPPQEQAATEAERIAALERALLPVKAAAEAEAAEYRRLCPPPSPLTPSAVDPCVQAGMGTLPAGTEVVVLKRTAGSPLVQIKVVTGRHAGKVGWVEEEHLSK
jgi:hypothetical protein